MSEENPNRCPYCTKKTEKVEEKSDELYDSETRECSEHGIIRIAAENL